MSKTHCWKCGPAADDGCTTTCMLPDGHKGPHKWTRDDRIGFTFAAPAPPGKGKP